MADNTAERSQARDELYRQFNNAALQRGEQLHGESFLRNVSLYAELDPGWTEAWMTYVYDNMYGRQVLDDRTRVLIVIGETIAAGHFTHLTHHMNTAIRFGIEPREILEVCLQSAIHLGMPCLRESLSAFRACMTELGVMSFVDPPF